MLDTFDAVKLEPLVREKVSEFLKAAARITTSLIGYYHKKKFRSFFRGVLVAQK